MRELQFNCYNPWCQSSYEVCHQSSTILSLRPSVPYLSVAMYQSRSPTTRKVRCVSSAYGNKLEAWGVSVERLILRGLIHAFFSSPGKKLIENGITDDQTTYVQVAVQIPARRPTSVSLSSFTDRSDKQFHLNV